MLIAILGFAGFHLTKVIQIEILKFEMTFFRVLLVIITSILVEPRSLLTRRERLKSALYLRLKKRKRLFFGKKLEIFDFFLSENVA